MIKINLLPKGLKKRGKAFVFTKGLIYFLAGGIGLILVLILITIFQGFKIQSLDRKITQAERKKEELRQTIQLVDALGDLKKKILDRMSAIESLDRNRSAWIEIMEDLSLRVPENVWLSSFKETSGLSTKEKGSAGAGSVSGTPGAGGTPSPASGAGTKGDTTASKAAGALSLPKITLEGYAFSINNLATFLIKLSDSNFFKNMELQYIRAAKVENQKIFTFQLIGDLLFPGQTLAPVQAKEVKKEITTKKSVKTKSSEKEVAGF